MNRIDRLFRHREHPVLSIYFTAGFPRLQDTAAILAALQQSGADLVEIGIPYSDPLADGPVIQHSSMVALQNGISIGQIFSQLRDFRKTISLPVILMGYLNPVLQYGIERFCEDAANTGVDGLILPDLPLEEYESSYRKLFRKHGLYPIFLVTPETSDERIQKIDSLSRGFLYAVSSSSTTGTEKQLSGQQPYFERLARLQLKNPVMIGFGIRDHQGFVEACRHASGAVIGTGYIRALEGASDVSAATREFVHAILSADAVPGEILGEKN